MEIELKYLIENNETAEAIQKDSGLLEYKVQGSENEMDMQAVYFDTKEGLLQENFIAFRIRKEGTRSIATLKWGGGTEGALHSREELNVSIGSGEIPDSPDIGVFSQSEIGEKIIEIIGDKKLIPIMEMNIKRKLWQAEDKGTVVEFALDSGFVSAQQKREEINELEIELITGSEEKLKVLGDKLSAKYDLKPEKRSKYERGLALLEKR